MGTVMGKTVSHQFRSLPDAGWRYLMHFATLKVRVVAPLISSDHDAHARVVDAARSMHVTPQPTVTIIATADHLQNPLNAVVPTFIIVTMSGLASEHIKQRLCQYMKFSVPHKTYFDCYESEGVICEKI